MENLFGSDMVTFIDETGEEISLPRALMMGRTGYDPLREALENDQPESDRAPNE